MRNKTPINVGIIGGAGYTAGELLRILLHHHQVNIAYVHSKSNAGRKLYTVHQDLLGETEITFAAHWHNEVDLLFLCVGHGDAKRFLEENKMPNHLKIIDLSQDFRMKNDSHNFVYGLPELHLETIKTAQFIANPGCFATAIQLGLLPLAAAKQLSDDVHINAITGSTGAGQKPTDTTHFSWRNGNISVYEAFQHRHLNEISQSLRFLQPQLASEVNFLPVRGNFTRGIFASIYMKTDLTEIELKELFQNYYQNAAFTFTTDENPSLKQVIGTNKAILNIVKKGNKVLIISMIDNLLKGASGQAVHNMNLMFGFDEKAGLSLKGIGF